MKKTLTVFTILNAIFLAALVTITVLLGVTTTMSTHFALESVPNVWTNLLAVFTDIVKLFTSGGWTIILGEVLALLSILIFVVILIVWIIKVVKSKKPAMIAMLVLFLLNSVGAFFVSANFNTILLPELKKILGGVFELTSIYVLVMVITGLLSIILGMVAFVIGAIAMKKPCKKVAEEEVEVADEDVIAADASERSYDQILDAALPPEPEEDPEFLPEPEPEDVEPAVEEETVPVAVLVEEPAPEPAPEPVVEEKPVEAVPPPAPSLDPAGLASMLRDVVRDIVRDELARAELAKPKQEPVHTEEKPVMQAPSHTITGATFGGPLVVQYFNSTIPATQPYASQAQPQPQPEVQPVVVQPVVVEPVVVHPVVVEAPAPAPEPVKEEPKPEPAPAVVPEPVVVVVPAPAPVVEKVVEPAPAPAPVVAKPVKPVPVPEPKVEKVYERISFTERMLDADKEMKENYNELKNEILSWGVNSRISNSGDTFRLHRKTYVKLTIAGKSLKLYFALDPKDYKDSTTPVQDAGNKDIYKEIPLIFKVKSALSMRRAKELIQDAMEKDNLEQGEIGKVNWVKDLKANAAK